MTVRMGDIVFGDLGRPALVKDRNGVTGELKVEDNRKEVGREMRHGYINGIRPEARGELYEILDEAKETENPKERTDLLRQRLEEVEKDPRRHELAKYLRAEMMHIMNTHGIRPTEYVVDETKVR